MSKWSEQPTDCELRLRDGSSVRFGTDARQLELPETEWQAAQDGRAIVSADVEAAEDVKTTLQLAF